jgi:dihydrofolate reductase
VEWPGSKLVKGDLTEEIRRLKREPGHDLLLSGSAQLFNALMKENLIDLYRFMVHPVVLGKGKRLFAEGNDKRVLDLAETKRFSLGIVVMEYRPAKTQ